MLFCRRAIPNSFLFLLLSLLALSFALHRLPLTYMPITEQQAAEWTGAATADSLVPIPTGRLDYRKVHEMVDFSTSVIYCIVPGGPTLPIFTSPRHPDVDRWCQKVLERDERKRAKCRDEVWRWYGNGGLSQDDSFRRTFGHETDLAPMGSALQFLRVSCSPWSAENNGKLIRRIWLRSCSIGRSVGRFGDFTALLSLPLNSSS